MQPPVASPACLPATRRVTRTAFSAFVADVYAAVRGQKPDGLPTFDDGLRAAAITEAVVTSSASSTWTEVHV